MVAASVCHRFAIFIIAPAWRVQNKHGCNAIDEQSSNAFSSSLSLFVVVTIYFQVIDLQYLVATYILDPSKQQLTYFLFY